jgi:hypothetical protein
MKAALWVELLLLFAMVGSPRAARAEIADPMLRTAALRTVFPGMDVVATTRRRDDSAQHNGLTFPDAFATSDIYQVNGPANSAIEQCASADMADGKYPKSREVRLILLPWPKTRADVLAVVQYRFIGAHPTVSCSSIGLLAHLARRGPEFEVIEKRLVETQHHTGFAGIRMVDVTGDGIEELVVEPNSGGAGTIGTTLMVFDLSGRRFRQILETESRLEFEVSDRYAQELDPERSAGTAGQSICFDLTVFVKGGKTYAKPHITHECYPVGTGVDEKQAERLNRELRPLTP